MCSTLLGGTPNYGSQANVAEQRRQGNIKYGTNLVNSVFGGGTSPVYSAFTGTPVKGTTYYTQNDKGAYVPFNAGLSSEKGRAKRGNLYTMQNQTFSGFTPQFYQGLYNAYMNQAIPGFNDQYRQARNQIGFGLANRGLYNSGAARTQYSDLARATLSGQQQLADQAQSQVQSMQQNVANAQNQLISQLYQGADPAQGLQSAIGQAALLKAPNTFAPVVNTFSNLLNTYYTNQLLNAYRQPGLSAPAYGPAGYGSGSTLGWQAPVTISSGNP